MPPGLGFFARPAGAPKGMKVPNLCPDACWIGGAAFGFAVCGLSLIFISALNKWAK